ncbi:NACHT domain-containing protein [Kitasatospora sp. NPDC057738]|uniref:NACHT domain-containing protein n=1 Tax=Kitasatospora sp. NPDC057738 TaxID=3346233 RepID=UPI00369B922A
MSPRAGGETDKFGNRYEGVWTVRHLLYVLLGNAQSIKIEDIDALGKGAEFTYRHGDTVEVHQVKRQNGNANSWNVKSLHKKEIWENARYHVERGRHFHFVSVVPARPIQELTERARSADDLMEFISDRLTKGLKDAFDELSSSAIYGSADVAWKVLRGLWVSWPDENDLVRGNAALAELLLSGATGRLAAVGLGDLANYYGLGSTLDSAAIESWLEEYGLRCSALLFGTTVSNKVREVTAGWAASVERELLRPAIRRTEADKLVELLDTDSERLTLLMGAAGGGKSATLLQAVQTLQEREIPLLSFRLDRLEPFASTTELGQRIGLDISPVAALASVARERPCVLIVDQVDAVSLVSGRMPRNFDSVADLVREASAFPKMRVLLVCRKFDVENDHRIRELLDAKQCERVEVQELSEAQVTEAVKAMGLDVAALSTHQKNLLRSPLNLVLLRGAGADSEALAFQTTKNLFDAFWQRKLIDCTQRRDTVRFDEVISTLAGAISVRQRLSVPATVLDRANLAVDAGVLVSEHMLVRDGQEIAFFHEAFFDYAFARGWVDRNESLLDFLKSGEQELFRRAQVRQILNHLRELEPDRFVTEVADTLTSPDVRFHIKDVILTLLSALTKPTSQEWEMVTDVLETHPSFGERLWRSLRGAEWFERIDAEGLIEEWLTSGDGAEIGRALEIMGGAAKVYPDRLAALLQAYVTESDFPARLRWVTRFADIHESRPLFELVLHAVRNGHYDGDAEHDLWISSHDLAEHQPAWAVELLAAYLADRPNSMVVDSNNKVAALVSREHSAIELVRLGAEGAPGSFCDLLLPYMLRVMAVTSYEGDERPTFDRHFAHRYPDLNAHELEEAILAGMASAIRSLVLQDSELAQPILETLASSHYEAAQWLLYEGLRVDGKRYAQWATRLLLEGTHRFMSGYSSNGVWTARQLIQATSPFCTEESYRELEASILALRFPWEGRRPGWYMFNLLSGMDEQRLSDVAKRRLGELRRAAGMEQPPEPEGVTGGGIGSPIPPESAQRMTDQQWLGALAKHSADRTNWSTFTGGAQELSSVLRQEAERDPARFSALALRFDRSTHPAYGTALLIALGAAEALDNGAPVFDAVRHISSFDRDDNSRWVGHALRHYYKSVPLDLVETIVAYAARSDSPGRRDPDTWSSDDDRNIGRDVYGAGINSVRGAAAETLGDLLIYDTDGSRTSLILPILNQLAGDASTPVRSCAAHLIHASMRHARPQAFDAFADLIETDDDNLFATHTVIKLIVYIGSEDPDVVRPVIARMLQSQIAEVRRVAGQLAALAAVQWSVSDLLDAILSTGDVAQREGAARLCAHRLSDVNDSIVVRRAFEVFMNDSDKAVQNAVGEAAAALRGKRLRPVIEPLSRLISSASFSAALPQLFITLEHAPDRVDDLVLACSQRFIEVKGADSDDMRTGAAGDARYVGKLLIRAYAQAAMRTKRAKVLDLIDQLLEVGALGVADLVERSER